MDRRCGISTEERDAEAAATGVGYEKADMLVWKHKVTYGRRNTCYGHNIKLMVIYAL
jgi:hypothetical protein